eukprot:363352-Prymnesium_polylepis.1
MALLDEWCVNGRVWRRPAVCTGRAERRCGTRRRAQRALRQDPRVAEHAELQRRRDERRQAVGGAPHALLVKLAHPQRRVLRAVRRAHLAAAAEAGGEARPFAGKVVGARHEVRRGEGRLARIEFEAVDACARSRGWGWALG